MKRTFLIKSELKDDIAKAAVEAHRLTYNPHICEYFVTSEEVVYVDSQMIEFANLPKEAIEVKTLLQCYSGSPLYNHNSCWDEFNSHILDLCINKPIRDEADAKDEQLLIFMAKEYPKEFQLFMKEQHEAAFDYYYALIPDEYEVDC